jgi:hypothetical protein
VFTDSVKDILDRLSQVNESDINAKSNKVVLGVARIAFGMLSTFPPDDEFFKDPLPSLNDPSIWRVVTAKGKQILIKAEYRLREKKCVVTEFAIK